MAARTNLHPSSSSIISATLLLLLLMTTAKAQSVSVIELDTVESYLRIRLRKNCTVNGDVTFTNLEYKGNKKCIRATDLLRDTLYADVSVPAGIGYLFCSGGCDYSIGGQQFLFRELGDSATMTFFIAISQIASAEVIALKTSFGITYCPLRHPERSSTPVPARERSGTLAFCPKLLNSDSTRRILLIDTETGDTVGITPSAGLAPVPVWLNRLYEVVVDCLAGRYSMSFYGRDGGNPDYAFCFDASVNPYGKKAMSRERKNSLFQWRQPPWHSFYEEETYRARKRLVPGLRFYSIRKVHRYTDVLYTNGRDFQTGFAKRTSHR